jgi:hypothetical protein
MFEKYEFEARDGFPCNLLRAGDPADSTKGPVLLVHGAGVRGNIFNPPNEQNLVQVLKQEGYDVWLENWRGSIECRQNEWDLDIVADNDHPAAVEEVCRITGSTSVKAVIHCQGSTSFMISAVKGLVPQVKTIVTNAVSLHPVVPEYSKFKLNYFVPVVKYITNYLNPHWGDEAPDFTAKLFRSIVQLTHHEKDTTVGKMVSFTYGAGHPALWELSNLTENTKEWIRNEFGSVPITFFEHIRKCVDKGVLVSKKGNTSYARTTPATNARMVFLAGKLNKCFSSQSQQQSYNYFNALQPKYHTIYEYDTYSHLDVFLGKNAHKDIFPTIVKELNA